MDALDAIGQLPLEFICPTEVTQELDEGAAQGYHCLRKILAAYDPERVTRQVLPSHAKVLLDVVLPARRAR